MTEQNKPELELSLQDFKFSYSFTQTVTGFAAATSREKLAEALAENFGEFDNFSINEISELTDEERELLHSRLTGTETIN